MTGGMTRRQYIARVHQELAPVQIPDGHHRREDVAQLPLIFDYERGDVAWLDEGAVEEDVLSIEEASRAATEHALEITSLLYATGAPHPLWRRWAGLSSFGLLFDGRIAQANHYALLAGEWHLAADLPPGPAVDATYYAEHVILALSIGASAPALPSGPDGLLYREDVGEVWDSFFAAMVEENAVLVTLALHTITELHIDLFGEGWKRFFERDHPLFDLVACAAAALARHHDLVTDELSPLDRQYLDPGLAEGEPTPLYPAERPVPSPVVGE